MLIATYIVRLYRFKNDRPRSLMGVVEEVGVKGRKAFNHYDELWDILNASKSVRSHRKEGGGKKSFSRGEEQKSGRGTMPRAPTNAPGLMTEPFSPRKATGKK